MFLPSRPDFIETIPMRVSMSPYRAILFRPSRPDFIETTAQPTPLAVFLDCSGHLGRTSLRLNMLTKCGLLVGGIVPAF